MPVRTIGERGRFHRAARYRMPQGQSFDVRRIAADAADRPAALRLALSLAALPAPEAEERLVEFLADARDRSLSTDLLVGAYVGAQLVSSALSLGAPGRAALVFATNNGRLRDPRSRAATIECLHYLRTEAQGTGTALLQVLTQSGSPLIPVLEAAGFRRLTRLIYLQRHGAAPTLPATAARDLEWLDYSPQTHPLFREAIGRSYAQSMDCPELTGIRSLDEVIEGHKAAGPFRPALWWVARRADQPVGVMLLSPIARQAALEIVYMGVAQPSRGTGVAHALLARAAGAASAMNVTPAATLALAVDERNVPARALYARWNFTPVGAREAFIVTSTDTRG